MGAILWLASYPKSGNTWLRAFLANMLTGAETPFPINQLSDFTASDLRAGYFEEVAQRPLAEMGDAVLHALRPRVHRYLAELRPDTTLVKTHNALIAYDGVSTITPEVTVGAIYLMRNPLDVAVSYSRHLGLSLEEAVAAICHHDNHTVTAGRTVFQILGTWQSHVMSWVQAPGLTIHVARYEDLLDAPEKSFGKIARFLGLRPTPEQLDQAIRFASFEELKAQEERDGFRERSPRNPSFFRQGRRDGWREMLSTAQVERIVEINRVAMERFGYLPLER